MHTDTPAQSAEVLWTPGPEQLQSSRLVQYQRWLEQEKGLVTSDYAELWRWSVEDIDRFWQSIWSFFDIQADGSREPALGRRTMPGAEWFPNARLNFAEHVFRNATAAQPAVIAHSEEGPVQQISWAELERSTAALAATLRDWGVQPGDRVAAYMPNRPETVIAFLACASIGAVWSSCAPDMGGSVVLDRLRQTEPKILFAIDSYSYKGKHHDRLAVVNELLAGLPSVERVVQVPGPLAGGREVDWRNASSWESAVRNDVAPRYERLPFAHPLWILYSSGTTGLPKAMVHSQGGILLTHLKEMGLQNDLRPGDRLLFLGSTSWAVWNLLVGALVTGASIVLYDGHPWLARWRRPLALHGRKRSRRVRLRGGLPHCLHEGRPEPEGSFPAPEVAQHPVHGIAAADRSIRMGLPERQARCLARLRQRGHRCRLVLRRLRADAAGACGGDPVSGTGGGRLCLRRYRASRGRRGR